MNNIINNKIYNEYINWGMFFNNSLKVDQSLFLNFFYKDIVKNNYKINLYLHFPFCESYCVYCPYLKQIVNNKDSSIEKYCNNLKKQITLWKDFFIEKGILEKIEVETISYGGGTPSFIDKNLLLDVTKHLFSEFHIEKSKLQEFTIEINPKQEDYEKMLYLKEYGVNRLSLGIQTFDGYITKITGRGNKNIKVEKIIKQVEDNFEKYNIDMIYNLPFQTNIGLENDLKKILEIKPKHISYYPLYIFPETGLNKSEILKEKISSWEDGKYNYNVIYDLFINIKTTLNKDYNFYTMDYCSLSSFDEHLYQKKYLLGEPLIGIGPSAYTNSEHTFAINNNDIEKFGYKNMYIHNKEQTAYKKLLHSIRLNKKLYKDEEIKFKREDLEIFEEFFNGKKQGLQYYLLSYFMFLRKKYNV